jgi:hypothetical protein
METVTVTDFELKILRMVKRNNGHIPTGDKCIHYRAAARRLEKKGLVFHSTFGNRFPLSKAGEEYIEKRIAEE